MGKYETTTASLGIKILLSDLVLQINETNCELIKTMLLEGFIEDENDYFNEVYDDILSEDLPSIDLKEYLETRFKTSGSYDKTRKGIVPDLSDGCLFDKKLLVSIKSILMVERWGYERYGTNGASRPIDFDLSVNLEEYKEIKKYEIVFLLKQDSG